MIHQNQIKRRADEDGLSAPAVERDYVLAHVLTAISEHDQQAQIVFKLHELLVTDVVDAEAIWPLFERKARHRDRDPGWNRELAEYVVSPPHLDGVLRAVRRELRFALT